jgi:hypothetical protein
LIIVRGDLDQLCNYKPGHAARAVTLDRWDQGDAAVSTDSERKSRHVPMVAPFHHVQLRWGTLFGFAFFSTVPDLWTALGASFIIMSGLFLIYREHVRHRALTTGITAHGGFGKD